MSRRVAGLTCIGLDGIEIRLPLLEDMDSARQQATRLAKKYGKPVCIVRIEVLETVHVVSEPKPRVTLPLQEPERWR